MALSAEIADGWLPLFFAPKDDAFYRRALQEGFDREGAKSNWDDFDVPCIVPFIPNPDVEAGADMIRPTLALYIGGMGAKGRNFHRDVFDRMGYEADCEKIQELYLSGDKAAAIAAVPTSMVEATSLIGAPEKIKDDLAAWESSVVTTLLIQGPAALLELAADIVQG